MFREMRRSRQLLSTEETKEMLMKGTHGVLAVSGDGGYPYAVPVSYVFAGGKILFHAAQTGHKLDGIARNDKVSFCVVGQDEVVQETYTTHYRSAIAFGRARVLTERAEKEAALLLLAEKYAPDMGETRHRQEIERSGAAAAVVEITVEQLTGKECIELVRQKAAKSEQF